MNLSNVRTIAVKRRIILRPTLYRNRKTPAGIDPTGQDLGNRTTAFLSRIPGHKYGTRLIDYWCEINPAAGIDHHNQIRIEHRRFGNLLQLLLRQRERTIAILAFGRRVEAGTVDDGISRFDLLLR